MLKLNVLYVYVYFMPPLTDTLLVCWQSVRWFEDVDLFIHLNYLPLKNRVVLQLNRLKLLNLPLCQVGLKLAHCSGDIYYCNYIYEIDQHTNTFELLNYMIILFEYCKEWIYFYHVSFKLLKTLP